MIVDDWRGALGGAIAVRRQSVPSAGANVDSLTSERGFEDSMRTQLQVSNVQLGLSQSTGRLQKKK